MVSVGALTGAVTTGITNQTTSVMLHENEAALAKKEDKEKDAGSGSGPGADAGSNASAPADSRVPPSSAPPPQPLSSPGRATFTARAPPCSGWLLSTRTGGAGFPTRRPSPRTCGPEAATGPSRSATSTCPPWTPPGVVCFAPSTTTPPTTPRRAPPPRLSRPSCVGSAARISASGSDAPARLCPARRCARSGARPTARTAARRSCTATSKPPTSCFAAWRGRSGRRRMRMTTKGTSLRRRTRPPRRR